MEEVGDRGQAKYSLIYGLLGVHTQYFYILYHTTELSISLGQINSPHSQNINFERETPVCPSEYIMENLLSMNHHERRFDIAVARRPRW